MSKPSDQEIFLTKQYQNATNLNARGNLHAWFRTNPYGWFRWVFDHFDLPVQSRVLELGCGPAGLWRENLYRIPAGWKIVLSDFSPGMIQAAKQNLIDTGQGFEFKVVDAQSIPYKNENFEAVIANHMLYHVPDREKSITEIYRVLKPGGKFFAATNGQGHIKEINDLRSQWVPKLAAEDRNKMTSDEFTLENGAVQIKPPFHRVQVDVYEDALEVTEAEPLLAYILSVDSCEKLETNTREVKALKAFLEKEVAEKGSIHITKSTGIFISSKSI